MCKECAKKERENFRDPEKFGNTETKFLQSMYIPLAVRETLKPKLTAMLPFADEEVYSAEFVYESIYEEIPAEVSQVKVKPLLH